MNDKVKVVMGALRHALVAAGVACRKCGYATLADAKKHRDWLVMRNTMSGNTDKNRNLNIYRCPRCRLFHLGHKSHTSVQRSVHA